MGVKKLEIFDIPEGTDEHTAGQLRRRNAWARKENKLQADRAHYQRQHRAKMDEAKKPFVPEPCDHEQTRTDYFEEVDVRGIAIDVMYIESCTNDRCRKTMRSW